MTWNCSLAAPHSHLRHADQSTLGSRTWSRDRDARSSANHVMRTCSSASLSLSLPLIHITQHTRLSSIICFLRGRRFCLGRNGEFCVTSMPLIVVLMHRYLIHAADKRHNIKTDSKGRDKLISHNTYIAQQAAYCYCSGAVFHTQRKRTAIGRSSSTMPRSGLQPYNSGVNPAEDRGDTPPKKCRMGDGNASCPPNMAEISLHSDWLWLVSEFCTMFGIIVTVELQPVVESLGLFRLLNYVIIFVFV